MENFSIVANMQRSLEAYEIVCKPVCEKWRIPLPALDILMTLADNPNFITAKEISRFKAFKPNLVSFHVDKLVSAGFLERQSIEGNRRSIKLVCTEKAMPVIEHGRKMRKLYQSLVCKGLTEEELADFRRIAAKIDKNTEAIKAEAKAGTLKLD